MAPRSSVILSGPKDWKPWFKVIKKTAQATEVWDYIDPDYKKPKPAAVPHQIPLLGNDSDSPDYSTGEAPNPVLSKPTIPTPGTVKPGATTLYDLDPQEKEEYKRLEFVYKAQPQEYNAARKALGAILKKIKESIHGRPNAHQSLRYS